MTPGTQGLQAAQSRSPKWCRNGRERETEGCGYNEDRQNWTFKSSEEQPDVSGDVAGDATWDHGGVLAWAATGVHVWICLALQQQGSVTTKG